MVFNISQYILKLKCSFIVNNYELLNITIVLGTVKIHSVCFFNITQYLLKVIACNNMFF